jgi:hypothetical protein
MKSKVNKLLEEIKIKKDELVKEYEKLREKYDFEFVK